MQKILKDGDCWECKGTGKQLCCNCGGRGFKKQYSTVLTNLLVPYSFPDIIPCSRCNATGSEKCTSCRGTGRRITEYIQYSI